jgi:hypothetical protein
VAGSNSETQDGGRSNCGKEFKADKKINSKKMQGVEGWMILVCCGFSNTDMFL